jgi:hypothetical protein
MRMLTAARGAVPGLAPGKPNVEYVALDGTLHAVPLADAARVRLTDMQPSRRFKARKGQRNLPGRWWSATDGRHVGDESWLERGQIMRLDWDQAVTGIASQPCRLRWTARVCRYFSIRCPRGPIRSCFHGLNSATSRSPF